MQKYNWLTRKHQKAIQAFVNARNDLTKVLDYMDHETADCDKRVQDHVSAISQEQEASKFLLTQRSSVTAQIMQIDKIINP